MTKKEAVQSFIEHVLPRVPFKDQPALDQAWNDYTDMLCKDREITSSQYSNWTHPRISKSVWKNANNNA